MLYVILTWIIKHNGWTTSLPLVNKVSLYIKSKYSFLINAMHKAESGWPFLDTGQFMLLMFADFGPFWTAQNLATQNP